MITGEEINLPPDNLHTYIIGNTGMGKTTVERSLIADPVASGHGVCVIDPHGERKNCLVDCVLSDIPKKRIKDVILFDVNNSQYVPGLKPFYCRDKNDLIAVQDTISTALNMFEKVYNVDRNTMARIIAYIESLIYLFIYDESLSLLDIPQLLNPDMKYDKKRLLAVTHLPPSPGFNFTRDFWTEEYSRRAKRGYNQDSEIFGTLMKFRELSSHLLWPMFCQKTNTLDLRHIMQQKKILLVKLNGNWEDITSLLGTYLIGQIKDAAFHRSLKDTPFYLYVDEFQRMASRDFLTLFSEARGGNVHVTVDHQIVSQLDEDMKETIRQASTFVCFGVTDITAASIAGMFDTTPPPGEWIYEKIMRKAGDYYEAEVWDSPEAEREYNALGEQMTQTKQLALLTENKHSLLPAPSSFPIKMTPHLWNIAEKLMTWFRPYIYDDDFYAYLRNLYECHAPPVHFEKRYYQWKGCKKNSVTQRKMYTDYNYYVKTYRADFSGNQHLCEVGMLYKDTKRTYLQKGGFQYYAIKPHIKAGNAYRFPLHFPCDFEESNGRIDPELIEEIRVMYAPFKRHAYYLFDPKEYETLLLRGSYDNEDLHYNRHPFFDPWKGPYFPKESDWVKIIKWFYDKAYETQALQRSVTALEEKRNYLYQTYHRVETRFHWLGWYEPEPVEEWEYLAHVKAFMRASGQEFMVGENSKYRARQGRPLYGSDEVERRIVNQIKKLDKYTARVRIPSGEYTMTTLAPKELLPDKQRVKRIEHIYAHNLKSGYLRLRSDVEKELTQTYPPLHQGNSHTPVQSVPLPSPRRK